MDPSSSRPVRRGRPPGWLLALALVLPLGALGVELYLLDGGLGFPLDDSWIHLQFARNLAAGEGLAFNPGERVPGSTAPLWTALLALAHALPAPLAAAKGLAILWHLLAVAACWRLAGELGLPRPLAGLAAALVALTGWLAWSALAAMEVPLFVALSLEGMAAHLRERREPARLPLSGPLLGLASLARPEGLLLLALAVADRLLVWRRERGALALAPPPWRGILAGAGLAALLLVPVALLNRALAGSALPSTFATKAGYAPPGFPRLGHLQVIWGIFFQAHPVPTLLAAAGLGVLVARLGTRRDAGLLLAAWAVALPVAYATLSAHAVRPIVGNFGRYFFPLLPVVLLLAALAVAPLRHRVPGRLRLGRLTVAWPAIAAALLLLPSLVASLLVLGRYGQSVLNVEDSDVRAARALAPILPPEAVLAVNDIGAVKYLLPNRVVDLAGIVTPEVHAWARRAQREAGSWQPGILAYVRQVEPDYLLVFPSWFGPVLLQEAFVPLLRFPVRDNITMGGDELVLFATPWTRHPLRLEAAADPGER